MQKSALVVDDSSMVRAVVGKTLRSRDFEVIEAPDGQAALAVLGSRLVSLVLTDINMPKMDGIDLMRRVRQLPAHARTPILVLTTDSDTEHMKVAREVGASGWLRKPFRADKVLTALAELGLA